MAEHICGSAFFFIARQVFGDKLRAPGPGTCGTYSLAQQQRSTAQHTARLLCFDGARTVFFSAGYLIMLLHRT